MKSIFILMFFLFSINCFSQVENGINEKRQKQLKTIINYLKNNQIIELSRIVRYPLKRQNPIPNIKTKDEFILYYPILFDSVFRAKLIRAKFDSSNTINHYTRFGLFQGDIWLDDNGYIIAINYQSSKGLELLSTLHSEIKDKIYKSVSDWKKNILVCETDKLLIRIDLLDNNELRYISWNKPKKINDKPDLILFNGVQEFQGTMGGVTYTFTNQNWTYQINSVKMAEKNEEFGLFLKLFYNGLEKAIIKVKEIK